MPTVSVLMPSFNYAGYLSLAVASVLSQSYSDLELIITDDGSTDGSLGIAENWRRLDNRVVVVQHSVNRGLAAARNSGFAVSNGDFVALCDADDIWLSDKLRVQLDWLREHQHAGIVHSDSLIMNGEGNLTGQRFSSLFHRKNQPCSGTLREELCLRNFICNPTVMMRRECVDYAGGFDVRLRSLEDWVCWARVARRYSFGYIDEPLVQYRLHRANLSSQTRAMAQNRIIAISMLLDEGTDISPAVKSKMLYALGMSQLCVNEQSAARSTFQRLVRGDLSNLRGWARCAQAFCKCVADRPLRF